MKKVIYILSEFFAPFQNVGSVKFTKIAKYLSENPDNRIIVFTRKNCKSNDVLLEQDLAVMKQHNVQIFYINEGYSYIRKTNKLNRLFFAVYNRFLWAIFGRDRMYYCKNQRAAKRFTKKGLQIIKEKKLPVPDVILSTYDDWGSHYLAAEIKKMHPETKWIADFRDPIGAHIKQGKFRKLCDEYSLMVSRNADYLTAVSEGTFKSLVLNKNVKKSVVTNGFDYADYEYVLNKYNEQNDNCRKMKFVYTGSFYGNSLMPFFNAISDLIHEGRIDSEKIEIQYAGEYNQRVSAEIQQAGLEMCYKYKGILTRIESVQLQHEADVLLTAVWNTKTSQGIIGGKVLTYLMLKKPIIGIVIGDTPDSEIKALIERVHCGWCYEQARHEKDFAELKQVIEELYKKKMNGEPVSIEYNETELEKYNLSNIAHQYEQIYETIKG